MDDLKENTNKTTAKFEEANLELEQVQEINKNKHAQNEAYIERTNQLKTILSTLNQDTAQMLLDKSTLKDKEIKLKQVNYKSWGPTTYCEISGQWVGLYYWKI